MAYCIAVLDFDELFAAAIERRGDLDPEVTCYRWFHGYGEGVPGLTIDRYGPAAAIRFRHDLEPMVRAVADRVAQEPGVEFVTARKRSFGCDPLALVGDIPADRIAVADKQASYWLNFNRAGNPGLYLDSRSARDWLRANSDGRNVLNLFAFTGSLGIAAALGGARVTHIDSHGPTLAWARANCELNNLRTDDRDFARINIYQHLRKSHAGRRRWDGIILDPPPGSPEPKRKDRTPGKRGVSAIAPQCAQTLADGGWLLAFFHHDGRTVSEIEAEMANHGLAPMWRGSSGVDFVEPDESAKLRVIAFRKQ